MKQVNQKPNHCVPACFEAMLSDIGIKKGQEEIVRDNPEVFDRNGVAGCTSTWEWIFKKYGVQVSSWYEDEQVPYDFEKLKKIASNPNAKILLLLRKGDKHTVGLNCIKDNGDIEVMDPALDKPDSYNIDKQKDLNLAIASFILEGKVTGEK
jgi:hypothetical protein